MSYLGSGPTRFNTADDLTVTDDAEIQDDASVGGDLSVTGTTTLTDDLNVDSGTLFVDASTNRVGIGTSSPSRRLEIAGSVNTSDSLIKITNNVVGTEHIELQSGINGVSNAGFQLNVNGTARMAVTDAGNLQFNSGFGSVATAYGVRAWVNFNGTGTVAIREDGNVSSITDNGTGSYTVNFTNAMPDDFYSAVGTSRFIVGIDNLGSFVLGSSVASTAFDVVCTDSTGTVQDSVVISAAVLR